MAFSDNENKSKRVSALADINVTPLVDILLVLLIIFMVAAPTVHHGARLAAPDITPSDDKQPPKEDEKDTLVIDKEGKLKFRGKGYTLKDLAALIKADPQLKKTRELYLQADLDLPYGRVMEVIGSVRRAGIQKLGVVVNADELGIQPSPEDPPKKR
ncbi:MAG: protein TolR [Deltaproteobacteria bacterium]|nr:MAG: protein TolR [Deltaproteobacteria bacterium]